MKKLIISLLTAACIMCLAPGISSARGTRYVIAWPEGHIGPVYVQVFDIRVCPPYDVLDNFKVWVTWGDKTKCYDIGNKGVYTLQFYKYDYCADPMIISGNAGSFQIRYGMTPPWI
jgi:hypothetical protein